MNTIIRRTSGLLRPAAICIALVLFSCSKYDDSVLTEKISDIEGRVSKLEIAVKTLTGSGFAVGNLLRIAGRGPAFEHYGEERR